VPHFFPAGAFGGVLATQLSPPVQLHQLLTAFQTDWTSFVAYASMGAVLAAYATGRRRLQRRGREWSDWRTASFVGGVVVVFIAIGSGLASYDDSNFVMHVVQHLVLMNVAPIFLGLGAPITIALQAATRPLQSRILRVLNSRPVSIVTFPVMAAAISYVTMIVYFLTPAYSFSLRHPLFHDYTHLHFLLAGCIYWWVVIGVDHSRWRMSFPAKLAYLASGIPVNAILGIALVNSRLSIDPAAHTVSDTHAGGAVLWGIGELILIAGLAIFIVQWSNYDRREAIRTDRRLERELAERPDALAGGTLGLRPPQPPAE
jgi:putative copper resistance protein D